MDAKTPAGELSVKIRFEPDIKRTHQGVNAESADTTKTVKPRELLRLHVKHASGLGGAFDDVKVAPSARES